MSRWLASVPEGATVSVEADGPTLRAFVSGEAIRRREREQLADAARVALAAHQAADPHCTCPDCIEAHQAALVEPTRGQLAYEAVVRRSPEWNAGTPCTPWSALDAGVQRSWDAYAAQHMEQAPSQRCECGDAFPAWHGDLLRVFCCARCWARQSQGVE